MTFYRAHTCLRFVHALTNNMSLYIPTQTFQFQPAPNQERDGGVQANDAVVDADKSPRTGIET